MVSKCDDIERWVVGFVDEDLERGIQAFIEYFLAVKALHNHDVYFALEFDEFLREGAWVIQKVTILDECVSPLFNVLSHLLDHKVECGWDGLEELVHQLKLVKVDVPEHVHDSCLFFDDISVFVFNEFFFNIINYRTSVLFVNPELCVLFFVF